MQPAFDADHVTSGQFRSEPRTKISVGCGLCIGTFYLEPFHIQHIFFRQHQKRSSLKINKYIMSQCEQFKIFKLWLIFFPLFPGD